VTNFGDGLFGDRWFGGGAPSSFLSAWQLDIWTRDGGTLIKEGVDFRSLSARWVLNGAGSIQVELGTSTDIGTAAVGKHEFQLKRQNVVEWVGPWLGTDVDAKKKTLKCNGEGLWSWFRDRVVTLNLLKTAVNQQQIAWDLINHAQGQADGQLGVTKGTHNGSSITRNRFYCADERPNVADEVEAFTELNTGFDFEIQASDRTFDTWQPSRKAASGISLDGNKVDAVTYVEEVRGMKNVVTAISADECGPLVLDESNATLRAAYGRRHGVIEPDLDEEAEVQAAAREELRSLQNPRFDATVFFREDGTNAPAWSSLVVGNTLLLSDDRGYATYTNKVLRIMEKAVHLDNGVPNKVFIELVLSSAVDS
jgi:hypothetical protein